MTVAKTWLVFLLGAAAILFALTCDVIDGVISERAEAGFYGIGVGMLAAVMIADWRHWDAEA